MSEQEDSKKCLGLAFEHLKGLHATLAALMTDVAALRDVILKDPRIARRYRLALAHEVKIAKPLVAVAMQAYEEAILRVISNGDLRN